jgi:hypothetical protein
MTVMARARAFHNEAKAMHKMLRDQAGQ